MVTFKFTLIYYLLKIFGFDFTNLFNILNNLSLGVIYWFYNKIVHFIKKNFLIIIIRAIRYILTIVLLRLFFYLISRTDFIYLINNLSALLLSLSTKQKKYY